MGTQSEPSQEASQSLAIRRRYTQIGVGLLIVVAATFLPAGTFGWLWAWVYLGLYVAGTAIMGALMLPNRRSTIAKRSESQGMKSWDRLVGGLWGVIYFILIPLISGIDRRFGWTGESSVAVHLMGAVAFILGFALFGWAMVANADFSTVSRVETDRGQTVCTDGPYRVIRHPGYLGAVAQSLSVPLLLGSAWALLPGLVAAVLMGVRTALEDRMLHEELPGYPDYAARVTHRLVPGIW
jgi:protein-S-isoprenylcysteine O-methyltransferase Ste14